MHDRPDTREMVGHSNTWRRIVSTDKHKSKTHKITVQDRVLLNTGYIMTENIKEKKRKERKTFKWCKKSSSGNMSSKNWIALFITNAEFCENSNKETSKQPNKESKMSNKEFSSRVLQSLGWCG